MIRSQTLSCALILTLAAGCGAPPEELNETIDEPSATELALPDAEEDFSALTGDGEEEGVTAAAPVTDCILRYSTPARSGNRIIAPVGVYCSRTHYLKAYAQLQILIRERYRSYWKVVTYGTATNRGTRVVNDIQYPCKGTGPRVWRAYAAGDADGGAWKKAAYSQAVTVNCSI
jgi:hypothetical protein